MPTLITKLQYRDYEPDEFIDQKERTPEDTLALISFFPWDEQRHNVSVSLTNPSVTIEGTAGDFLKLAIYYNGQFVLYYLDAAHHLFTFKAGSYEETFPYIRNFFRQQEEYTGFDISAFHREQRLFQNNIVHFRSQSFTYQTNAIKALWVPSLFILPTFLFLAIVLRITFTPETRVMYQVIVLFFLLFLAFTIPTMLLVVNHWKASRGKALILSQGKDQFYYGPAENPTAYRKKDILQVVTVGLRGRHGYPRTTQIEIDFVDGTSLYFSCMMLRQYEVVAKFPHCRLQVKRKLFPFIPAGN